MIPEKTAGESIGIVEHSRVCRQGLLAFGGIWPNSGSEERELSDGVASMMPLPP